MTALVLSQKGKQIFQDQPLRTFGTHTKFLKYKYECIFKIPILKKYFYGRNKVEGLIQVNVEKGKNQGKKSNSPAGKCLQIYQTLSQQISIFIPAACQEIQWRQFFLLSNVHCSSARNTENGCPSFNVPEWAKGSTRVSRFSSCSLLWELAQLTKANWVRTGLTTYCYYLRMFRESLKSKLSSKNQYATPWLSICLRKQSLM